MKISINVKKNGNDFDKQNLAKKFFLKFFNLTPFKSSVLSRNVFN